MKEINRFDIYNKINLLIYNLGNIKEKYLVEKYLTHNGNFDKYKIAINYVS